jgi:hypothetical protein
MLNMYVLLEDKHQRFYETEEKETFTARKA